MAKKDILERLDKASTKGRVATAASSVQETRVSRNVRRRRRKKDEPEPVATVEAVTEPVAAPPVEEPAPPVAEVEQPVEEVVEAPAEAEAPVAEEPEPAPPVETEAEEEPVEEVAAAAEPEPEPEAPGLDDVLAAESAEGRVVEPPLRRPGKVVSRPEAPPEESADEETDETESVEAAAEPATEAGHGEGDEEKPSSLSEILEEQGIVHHKPGGRKVIEEPRMPERRGPRIVAPPPPGFQPPPRRQPPAPTGPPPPPGTAPSGRGDRRDDPDRERKPRDKPRKRRSARRMIQQDELFMADRRSPGRRRQSSRGGGKKTEITMPAAHKRVVSVNETITVGDLAAAMGRKGPEVLRELIKMGQMVTLNEAVDLETAGAVAAVYEHTVENVAFNEEAALGVQEQDDRDQLRRDPIVTIMGHVDHGKTSLLDAIRSADVASGEAGGITQHVSAFAVSAKSGRVCFVDTPGHAAFTEMRSRGAQVTDIVVLVVASDDGVMPQTVECIDHTRASGCPMIVAVNKMDLPDANVQKVMQGLMTHEIIPEAMGGEIQVVEVSAKTGTGLPQLLEAINLQAEMMELTSPDEGKPTGRVLEAHMDKGRGPVATVIVQGGELRKGDYVVAGTQFGRVRTIMDDAGKPMKSAGPSTPVQLMGLDGLPEAGDELVGASDARGAKEVVEFRQEEVRRASNEPHGAKSFEELMEVMKAGELRELRLVVKADVQGTAEALRGALSGIEVEGARVNILRAAAGGITESDVQLAQASEAVVVGFNVRPDSTARRNAENLGVKIFTHKVIYEVVDEVKKLLVGTLDPTFEEKVLGHAEVRDLFQIPKVGTIAGCYVVDGNMQRSASVHLLRDGVVVWEGKMASLRRFKDDAKEVRQGFECGIGLDGYNDLKTGDIIEAFTMEEVRPKV